nr:hypothetical protein [Propionibacterium sp.]
MAPGDGPRGGCPGTQDPSGGRRSLGLATRPLGAATLPRAAARAADAKPRRPRRWTPRAHPGPRDSTRFSAQLAPTGHALSVTAPPGLHRAARTRSPHAPLEDPVDAPHRGINSLLADARAGLRRLTPLEVVDALADGALLIDTRTLEQRTEQGDLPGAICIDRTVLEWRLAPDSTHRIPEAAVPGRTIIVVCRQGYSSSLAAASLQAAGVPGATDMIGGFEAWVTAGLPLSDAPADVRR